MPGAPLYHAIVQYDQNSMYFCCKECSTHLAPFDELIQIKCIYKATLQVSNDVAADPMFWYNWTWTQQALFDIADNLRFGARTVTQSGRSRLRAYCNNCGTSLGFRMEDSGHYLLKLHKLMFWSGNEMVDPAVQPPPSPF